MIILADMATHGAKFALPQKGVDLAAKGVAPCERWPSAAVVCTDSTRRQGLSRKTGGLSGLGEVITVVNGRIDKNSKKDGSRHKSPDKSIGRVRRNDKTFSGA